jgi:UDP-N-acetyl-D-galactosamine dehydrogenase
VKLLIDADVTVKGARVGILGITFKEDCNDLRNSKVPDIHRELRQFGIEARVHDPLASAPEAQHEYGIKLASLEEMTKLDALVLAVSHKEYLDLPIDRLAGMVRDGGLVIDVKSALDPSRLGPGIRYWSL